jgi:hypothetical protein
MILGDWITTERALCLRWRSDVGEENPGKKSIFGA